MDNPWQALPLSPPFVLDTDYEAIAAFNRQTKLEWQIHLEALPEPFLGKPIAPVVLLSLNPGFGQETIAFHQTNTYFRESHRRNLIHEPSHYPFYLLDPKNAESPGYEWWWKHLRVLIETCGQQQVARNVFCVEYFPYASKGFGFSRILSSQHYGFDLVRQAMAQGAVVVAMRGERHWLSVIPSLKEYSQFFRLNSVQSVYVTENNCPSGYKSIVNRIQSTYN